MPVRSKERAQRTQLAAQFLAASELVRRYYAVSLQMGNNRPDAGLIVGTQTGTQFSVEVKGLTSDNEWLVTATQRRPGSYHIVVRVDDTRDQDRFFIVPQSEVNRLLQECNSTSAIPFLYLEIFENRWEMLPPARSL